MRKDEVSERMKELMTDQDRQQLFGTSQVSDPPGPQFSPDVDDDRIDKTEKQEHIILENWLNQHELWFDHQRMDKRPRNKKGNPDFIIGIEGFLIAIEFKRPGNKLSPAQEQQRDRCIGPSKCRYFVLETGLQAIRLLQSYLYAAQRQAHDSPHDPARLPAL